MKNVVIFLVTNFKLFLFFLGGGGLSEILPLKSPTCFTPRISKFDHLVLLGPLSCKGWVLRRRVDCTTGRERVVRRVLRSGSQRGAEEYRVLRRRKTPLWIV